MFLTQDLPLLQPITASLRRSPDRRPVPAAAARCSGLRRLRAGRQLRRISHSGRAFLVPNPVRCITYKSREPAGALWRHRGDWGGSQLIGPEWFPDSYPWVPSISPGLNFYFSQPRYCRWWRSRQHPAPDPATGLHLTRPRLAENAEARRASLLGSLRAPASSRVRCPASSRPRRC